MLSVLDDPALSKSELPGEAESSEENKIDNSLAPSSPSGSLGSHNTQMCLARETSPEKLSHTRSEGHNAKAAEKGVARGGRGPQEEEKPKRQFIVSALLPS